MLHRPNEVEAAVKFLRGTPLAKAIQKYDPPVYELATDPFTFLTRAIIFQQLSTKAATTIFTRFKSLVGEINPRAILSFSVEEFRKVGVSRQKAGYILDLASKVHNQEIHPHNWLASTEIDVRKQITSVKGLGEWSADMFCIFALAKPDIWPITDQGIKNGVRILLNRTEHLSAPELMNYGEQFQPYRSVAAHFIWRIADARPD